MNPRAAAARAMGQVLGESRSLATALPATLEQVAPQDRGLVQELCYGTCRWYFQLQWLLNHLLVRPLATTETTIRALLLIGLYQLWHSRVPDHAAVSETVNAARQLRKVWAAGLINAVLRAALKRRTELVNLLASTPEAQSAHPHWLLERLRQDWPDDWPAIIAANNRRPPCTLRVNPHHTHLDSYQLKLAEAGRLAQPVPGVPTALILSEPLETAAIPEFDTGWVSVQDAAAQLAAPLLDLHPGQRVLDACAAPGGKTGHLLEYEPHLRLVALEQSAGRMEPLRANLHRLRLDAHLITGDAAHPTTWWDGDLFDRILLDAPCSATGVIRRHPDIKLLRRESDIAVLVAQQGALLTALWPLLRPGGCLLYVTCSVLRQENERVIMAFLAAQPDASERPITANWGRALAHGRQTLPGDSGMDGFYYACLAKPASASGA
ncbi:MAG: 16S rRNA (cytosine(967)-C(5))-methyltransferase RsmB [Candidatus Competibacter denitrificans]